MPRRGVQPLWLICLSAALLVAADPSWKTKPLAQWSEQDAKEILSDSPWVKTVRGTITRRLSEDERREGGDMGQPRGIGYEGVDPKGSGPKIPTSIPDFLTGGNAPSVRATARPITLKVRWESALPVRIAEMKSGEIEPPTLEGEGYRIAVYGIPAANVKGTPKQLGNPLKKEAVLKREGKTDVKPSSVEVFQHSDGFVVVYLFPLSAEITKKDGKVQFAAQIGRIIVVHDFDLPEMELQGKLEL